MKRLLPENENSRSTALNAIFNKTVSKKQKQDTLYCKFCRVPCSVYILCFHIHHHAGLKFHGKFFFVDGDLLNQPLDQLLVIFDNGGGLLLQECSHIGDAFSLLIPACIFHLSLLLLFTQSVDFIGDILVVGFGVGQL